MLLKEEMHHMACRVHQSSEVNPTMQYGFCLFLCHHDLKPPSLFTYRRKWKKMVVPPCGNRSSNVWFSDSNGLRLVGKQNTASWPQPGGISVRGSRAGIGIVTWLGISSTHCMVGREWLVKVQQRPVHNWWFKFLYAMDSVMGERGASGNLYTLYETETGPTFRSRPVMVSLWWKMQECYLQEC